MKKGANTRSIILQKAFEQIYAKGYQTTSIDDILSLTSVTKGSFYHHFKNKDEMGLAIIEEVIRPLMNAAFTGSMESNQSPVKRIYALFKNLLLELPSLKVEHGCPIGNLVQELTPWHEAFSKALNDVVHIWKTTIENLLIRGQAEKSIRKSVVPSQVAFFILSGYWGIREFGKLQHHSHCYTEYLAELKTYLKTLKS